MPSASRAVSRSWSTSPTRTGPSTFRVMMRPWLPPSWMRHLTCMASPCIPVLPTTSMTSAAVEADSSSALMGLPELLELRGDVVDLLAGVAGVDDGGGGRPDLQAGGVADVVLRTDEDVRDVLLRTDLRQVHHDLLGLDVLGDVDQHRVASLDGLGRLVRSLPYRAGVPGYLKRLQGVLLEIRRDVEIDVN